MNAEINALNRFEEAGFTAGQSKAAVAGMDDLLVKSLAVINHRFDAINHRFDAIEHSMRFQMIGTVGVIVAILLGFAGLMYTMVYTLSR